MGVLCLIPNYPHSLDLGGQFSVGDRIRIGKNQLDCESEITEVDRFHLVVTPTGAHLTYVRDWDGFT